jgi:GTP-binding protein EngB required for normal cell division
MTQISKNRPGSLQDVSCEDSLRRLAQLASEFGAEQITSGALSVAKRVSEGRFYVACVGQFKRGKSTLINALVGHSVLPTAVVPVTAIPTIIRHGEHLSARVCIRGATWVEIPLSKVDEYVAEEKNPENVKNVIGVEIFVPSSLLEMGMCLVDTPGLGSVHSGNTDATRAFVPHIDAAIVVIGADPPLSGDELELVEMVGQEIQDIILVLNKADRTSDSERSAAMEFARRLIETRLKRKIPAIFEVSALERLESRGEGRDWPDFFETLGQLVEVSGKSLVRQASERGLRRAAEQLLAVIGEERSALKRPVEESEQRIAELRQITDRAEQSLNDLGFLFAAEQQRLSKSFEDRRNRFLKQACAGMNDGWEKELQNLKRRNGPAYRRDAMQLAQNIARTRIAPWLAEEEQYAEIGYTQIAQRFVDLANGFLESVREAGVSNVGVLPEAIESELGFRTSSRFYFHELERLAAPASPFSSARDFLLGLFGAYGSIVEEAREFLNQLLKTNSTRVQNDVDDRVMESRRRLEAEIRHSLSDVSGMATRALARAREVRAAGAQAVEQALSKLEAARREVLCLGQLKEN